MKVYLVDKVSALVGSLLMIIWHASTGAWSTHLAGGLVIGGVLVGSVVRAFIQLDERVDRENFLTTERERGEVLRLTASEKELITSLRDQERIEARR